MKKKHDNDKPVGKLTQIEDFLPPPSELLPKEETVKITLAVNKATLLFFRSSAKDAGTKYQRMMREVLNVYAKTYKKRA
jgi:predicted DNA binding CopG/RHH family protein